MRSRLFKVLVGLILVLVSPKVSPAALFEWGPEGSYVHQVSHLLFLAAMLFFIREMYRAGLQATRGFRYLIWSCWLLALWNLDAVIGHAMDWSLRNPVIMGSGLTRRLLMEDFTTWVFYITKLTHFLFLLPAIYLFYRGLKALAQEAQTEQP